VELRSAEERDIPALLDLINGYAAEGRLLRRTEESLRTGLSDFAVAEDEGELVGCGALMLLGPGLGEIRSLAVRPDRVGRGIGRLLVEHLAGQAPGRGFVELLALTRRVSFFEALGFAVTQRERYLDKIMVDCRTCPLNLCCDETAVTRAVPIARSEGPLAKNLEGAES
jgi:N-acetylglutamate synthase-like GNAT family acetyltransferase